MKLSAGLMRVRRVLRSEHLEASRIHHLRHRNRLVAAPPWSLKHDCKRNLFTFFSLNLRAPACFDLGYISYEPQTLGYRVGKISADAISWFVFYHQKFPNEFVVSSMKRFTFLVGRKGGGRSETPHRAPSRHVLAFEVFSNLRHQKFR